MRTLPCTALAVALLAAAAAGCGRGPDPSSAKGRVAGNGDTIPVTRTTVADTLPPCDGPCPMTASDVSGVYVLVEQNGHPLPSTTHYPDRQTPGRRCTAIIEGGTLTLREDGTFEERDVGRNWCNDMPTPTRSTADSLHGHFALHGPRGDSIAMGSTQLDPPAESEGVIIGSELRLVTTSEPARISFRYLRQRD